MRRFFSNVVLYAFHILFARPVLMWVVGVRYRGRSRLPAGPCLVVSNHNSHLDAAVLMTLFPLSRLPRVHPVAAADYFGSTWFKRMMAMLCMNAMAIERRPVKGSDPLAPIADSMKRGESLVFFPEGSRGKAGVVAPFRPGIGRLVRQLPGMLVVPVFLAGPERIWARGQVVPVPLNVDAFVGKPRTYDSALDAKTIAAQVREDVLALAPPPPPQPGPRPAPPIRVAVCGVDAQWRNELFRQLVPRLARLEHTLGIAEPMVEADADGVREITGPIPFARGRVWLRLLARIFRTGGRFKGAKFVKMVERAQIDEAIGHGRAARYVVTDGSALVDLIAWAEADFYRGRFDRSGMNHLLQYLAGQKKIPLGNWWRFIRTAPEVWLVNIFDLARPPVPDLLVLARQSIPRVMERLRSGGEEMESFENEEFLGRLQDAYAEVSEVLKRRRKVQLVVVDDIDGDRSQLLDEIVEACERLAEPAPAASP